jgi:hypothetical protein
MRGHSGFFGAQYFIVLEGVQHIMDVEIRLFVVDEQGGLEPLDKDKFDGAVERIVPLPQYQGQRVKIAGAMLQKAGGQVAEVLEVYGQYVWFDQDGYVDQEKLAESIRHTDKDLGEGYHNPYIWQPDESDMAKVRAALA